MVKMVERYCGFCFDGNGKIVDRQKDGRQIIKLNFPRYEDELAKKICEECLKVLNEYEE